MSFQDRPLNKGILTSSNICLDQKGKHVMEINQEANYCINGCNLTLSPGRYEINYSTHNTTVKKLKNYFKYPLWRVLNGEKIEDIDSERQRRTTKRDNTKIKEPIEESNKRDQNIEV